MERKRGKLRESVAETGQQEVEGCSRSKALSSDRERGGRELTLEICKPRNGRKGESGGRDETAAGERERSVKNWRREEKKINLG